MLNLKLNKLEISDKPGAPLKQSYDLKADFVTVDSYMVPASVVNFPDDFGFPFSATFANSDFMLFWAKTQ